MSAPAAPRDTPQSPAQAQPPAPPTPAARRDDPSTREASGVASAPDASPGPGAAAGPLPDASAVQAQMLALRKLALTWADEPLIQRMMVRLKSAEAERRLTAACLARGFVRGWAMVDALRNGVVRPSTWRALNKAHATEFGTLADAPANTTLACEVVAVERGLSVRSPTLHCDRVFVRIKGTSQVLVCGPKDIQFALPAGIREGDRFTIKTAARQVAKGLAEPGAPVAAEGDSNRNLLRQVGIAPAPPGRAVEHSQHR